MFSAILTVFLCYLGFCLLWFIGVVIYTNYSDRHYGSGAIGVALLPAFPLIALIVYLKEAVQTKKDRGL